MTEQNFTVLIADDEPGMRLILRKKIEKTDGFTLLGEAVNGEEAVSMFQQLHPQVVFLDVDMPERNGIECARAIQDMNPSAIIIFATAHEEYRQEAFEVYAFDYLVKPFNLERLEQTLEHIRKTRQPAEPKPLPRPAAIKQVQGRLMLKHKDGIAFIDQQEILLVQREERSTVIYTESGERYVLSESLSETEARLDPDTFFRCHKSYIINLRRIRNITPYGRWTYVVQLENTDHDALITYQKYEELEQRFS